LENAQLLTLIAARKYKESNIKQFIEVIIEKIKGILIIETTGRVIRAIDNNLDKQ
jgi:hypothetical protein